MNMTSRHAIKIQDSTWFVLIAILQQIVRMDVTDVYGGEHWTVIDICRKKRGIVLSPWPIQFLKFRDTQHTGCIISLHFLQFVILDSRKSLIESVDMVWLVHARYAWSNRVGRLHYERVSLNKELFTLWDWECIDLEFKVQKVRKQDEQWLIVVAPPGSSWIILDYGGVLPVCVYYQFCISGSLWYSWDTKWIWDQQELSAGLRMNTLE